LCVIGQTSARTDVVNSARLNDENSDMDTPIDARTFAYDNNNSWSAHFRATLALGIP
jgi:hypothetical protein